MEENKKIAEHDQPAVRFIFRSVVELSIHEETERLRVKKSRRRYVIERKMKKKILVYVPGTYISPFVVALQVCNHFVFFHQYVTLLS